MTRGIRGKHSKNKNVSRHGNHGPRVTRGELAHATSRQRTKITSMLQEIRLTPREIERFTPGRSDSFWHAAKTARWGNCRPTVQDYKDIKRIYDIGRAFVGKHETLRDDALDLATQASRVTLLARRLIDDVIKAVGNV